MARGVLRGAIKGQESNEVKYPCHLHIIDKQIITGMTNFTNPGKVEIVQSQYISFILLASNLPTVMAFAFMHCLCTCDHDASQTLKVLAVVHFPSGTWLVF